MLRVIPPVGNNNQLRPEQYDALRGYSPALCARIVAELGLTEADHLLDVACGSGKHTSQVAAIGQCSAIGVDVDCQRIEYARQTNPLIDWRQADAHDLPLTNGSMTAVQVILAMQRIRDLPSVLREIERVLSDSGQLVIATVAPEDLAERLDLKFFPEALAAEQSRFPDLGVLTGVMTEAGFGNIRTVSFVEPAAPADRDWLSWVHKKPYSTHRMITDKQFENQFETLAQFVTSAAKTISIVNTWSLVLGRKETASA